MECWLARDLLDDAVQRFLELPSQSTHPLTSLHPACAYSPRPTWNFTRRNAHADEDAASPVVLQMTLVTSFGAIANPQGSIPWTVGQPLFIGSSPVIAGPYTLRINDPSCTETITYDVEDPLCVYPVCNVSSEKG